MKKITFIRIWFVSILAFSIGSCKKELLNNESTSKISNQPVTFGNSQSYDFYLYNLTTSLKEFLTAHPDFKVPLKELLNGDYYENSIPYQTLKDVVYQGEKISYWLSAFCNEESLTTNFFESELPSILPTIGLYIKGALDDDDDENDAGWAETWNLNEDVNYGFLSQENSSFFKIVEDSIFEITQTENLSEELDGNILFFEDMRSLGYVFINLDNMETIDGMNPFEVAHYFLEESNDFNKTTTNPFQEQCDEATNALAAFLANATQQPGNLIFNNTYAIRSMFLQLLVWAYCTHPGIAIGNGGDIHRGCDRNMRNFPEQISQLQMPNKVDRKKGTYRRYEIQTDFAWLFARGYRFQINKLSSTNPNNPTPLVHPEQYIILEKKDLHKGKIYLVPFAGLTWNRWRLDEYGSKESYTFISTSRATGTTVTTTGNLSGTISWQTNGVTQTSNVSHSQTISHKVTDRPMGGRIVEYCDPANGQGHMYSLNSLRFWVREGYMP
jgi:hypothetical protein